MIDIRTYQDLDPNAPEANRYLARLTVRGTSILFTAPTPLDAQDMARAWIERERASAASQGRMGRERRATRQKASS